MKPAPGMQSEALPDRFQALAVILALISVLVLAFVAAPWWQEPPAPRDRAMALRPPGDGARGSGGPPSDATVADAVADALAGDGTFLPVPEVTVRSGVATLRGAVPALAARERAVALAGTIRGVLRVEDRMEVRPRPDLVAQVEAALRDEPVLSGLGLEVRPGSPGQVVVSGPVPGARFARLVREVAGGVGGVAEVVAEVRPVSSETLTDTELRLQVLRSLRWDALVEHGAIEVEAASGEVSLAGHVGSAAEKARAVQDTWGPGVVAVDARGLEVLPAPSDAQLRRAKATHRGDDEVRKALAEILALEPRLRGVTLGLAVEGGTTTLRGQVRTLAARSDATRAARDVVGVARVVNRLRVSSAPAPDLEPRLRGALERDAWLAGAGVAAEVRDGVAVLSGTVDTAFLRARAEEVAGRLEGIVAVRNRLACRDPRPPMDDPWLAGLPLEEWPPLPDMVALERDADLLAAVQEALRWNASVPEADIQASVQGGVATLQGSLLLPAEARAAVASALRAGAVRVEDLLLVEPVSPPGPPPGAGR